MKEEEGERGCDWVCREDRRGVCHLSGSPCLIREFYFWLRSEYDFQGWSLKDQLGPVSPGDNFFIKRLLTDCGCALLCVSHQTQHQCHLLVSPMMDLRITAPSLLGCSQEPSPVYPHTTIMLHRYCLVVKELQQMKKVQ